ncbi:MAG: hypothetical protein MZW92_79325 [Comamonadaceae bacterium]|nr:hypothetical protein [Comamonadaceae bacterium]
MTPLFFYHPAAAARRDRCGMAAALSLQIPVLHAPRHVRCGHGKNGVTARNACQSGKWRRVKDQRGDVQTRDAGRIQHRCAASVPEIPTQFA